ncbi:MAG: biopolymer transporter ExbD [Desulfurivibrionaceae bacterium]|nr:biopolymer transporter ExbD [Desulfurivibrionaceae bacterium]
MKIKEQPRRPARLEMLPLLDVVFLLLVFFIYAMLSMAVERGLHLDLPHSSQARPSPDQVTAVSLCRGAGGLEVYMDKDLLSLDLLGSRLESLVNSEATREPRVALFAEATISYQELFMVLDLIRASGVAAISLQAEAGE